MVINIYQLLLERKGLVTIRHSARPSDVAVWHTK